MARSKTLDNFLNLYSDRVLVSLFFETDKDLHTEQSFVNQLRDLVQETKLISLHFNERQIGIFQRVGLNNSQETEKKCLAFAYNQNLFFVYKNGLFVEVKKSRFWEDGFPDHIIELFSRIVILSQCKTKGIFLNSTFIIKNLTGEMYSNNFKVFAVVPQTNTGVSFVHSSCQYIMPISTSKTSSVIEKYFRARVLQNETIEATIGLVLVIKSLESEPNEQGIVTLKKTLNKTFDTYEKQIYHAATSFVKKSFLEKKEIQS